MLTTAEVLALADAVPARFRTMILVTTFASLRFGEVTALQRCDVDVVAGTVRVRQAYSEVKGKGLVLGLPKSRAGVRTVPIPRMVAMELADHLDEHVGQEPSALVFTGPTGAAIRRGNFNKLVKWKERVEQLGREGLHFHDLRHTGNMLAAATQVTTRDLMARMGHDSMQAALTYQHATAEAGRRVALMLDEALSAAQPEAPDVAG